MIQLQGMYYDGADSTAHDATVEVYEAEIVLRFGQGKKHLARQDLQIDARLGRTPRTLSWGGVERFVTEDHENADALLAILKPDSKMAWVSLLEQRMAFAVVALVVAAATAGGIAIWGIPAAASAIAYAAPSEVSAQLGQSTLQTIDQVLDPSTLQHERIQDLETLFRDHGEVDTIAFRSAGLLGPNALTLSANTVVFTDELVELAENDIELLAVYLHELGHARLRHVERSILQNSAWVVMLSVILGDVNAAGDLVLTLPLVVGQAAYSRDFEREADHFAMEQLRLAGHDAGALADILERLEHYEPELNQESDTDPDQEATSTDSQAEQASDKRPAETEDGSGKEDSDQQFALRVLEYLSTHPATSERVAYIRGANTP